MNNKVYIVTLESRVDCVTDTHIVGVYATMELAQKQFKADRNYIIEEYVSGVDSFETEEDTDTRFVYQYSDWDMYFELSIIEKEIINN